MNTLRFMWMEWNTINGTDFKIMQNNNGQLFIKHSNGAEIRISPDVGGFKISGKFRFANTIYVET